MGWIIYNSNGVPLVTSKAHEHTAADGTGPLTDDEHDGYSEYIEIAAPGAPVANKGRIYAADDGGVTRPYFKDTDGFATELAGYTLIASVTLGAPAQTLADFQNIPAKFRNLRVVYSGKSTAGDTVLRNIAVRFNNDAGANYYTDYDEDGARTQVLAGTSAYVNRLNGVNPGYATWGVFDISAYASAALQKGVSNHGGHYRAGNIIDYTSAALWNQTPAINRIAIFSDAATAIFDAGSVCYLYGY